MDKLEYIPGDLVMTNGVPLGTAKDVIYRVVSSNPSKTLKLDGDIVLKGVVCLENIEGAEFGDKGYLFAECCAWVKNIVPIPLAPEILEKNGWKKDKEEYVNDFYYLHLCGKYNGYSVYKVVNDNVVWLTGVRNVSDLQHLLFGLEHNSEMEV